MSKAGTFDSGAALSEVASEELPARATGRTAMKRRQGWFQVLRPLSPRARLTLGMLSFVLPIALWSIVTYVPFVWHPQMEITDPGSVDYLQAGMRMNKADFADAVEEARSEHKAPPQGVSVQSDLSAGAARGGDGAVHVFRHPAADQGRALAAPEPVAQHPGHLLGLRDFVDPGRAARHSVRHLCRRSRGSASRSSSSSAICRRRPSARWRSPSSASMTGRRSPSSSSAPSSSRC